MRARVHQATSNEKGDHQARAHQATKPQYPAAQLTLAVALTVDVWLFRWDLDVLYFATND